VLDNVQQVKNLEKRFLNSRSAHVRVRHDDYVSTPRDSGYRSVHLVYKYSSQAYKDHCGLRVEVQIRSKLQHIWATGVETVGAFTKDPLKSSIGSVEWLRFFSLLSSAFALIEGTPTVPKTPSDRAAIVRELRKLNKKINAVDKLRQFGTTANYLNKQVKKGNQLCLLYLQPAAGRTMVKRYRPSRLQQATEDYLATERDADTDQGEDVVLVTLDAMTSLRKAYSNYFMDTKRLVEILNELLGTS